MLSMQQEVKINDSQRILHDNLPTTPVVILIGGAMKKVTEL